jgi:hypothetical protein
VAPAAAASPAEDNVVPLSTIDAHKLWPMLVSNLQKQSQALSALNLARLDRIEDDVAYIRFGPNGGTFARMWQNNGKRDLIGRVLSSMLNRPTGVAFEVDDDEPPAGEAPASAPAAAASVSASAARPAPPRRAPAAGGEPPREPVPQDARPPLAITPELIAQLRTDPLLATVLDELSGQVVRVVEQ